MLPKEIAKRVPKTHLMSETEWRNLGVQQSQGWVHYMIHQPGMCSGEYGQFSKDFFHLIALLHSWVWNSHASVTKSTSRARKARFGWLHAHVKSVKPTVTVKT